MPKNALPHIDQVYSDLLANIIANGEDRPNRTGVGTRAIPSAYFRYDMAAGMPYLHGKKVNLVAVIAELAGFLNGITDKQWYKDQNCNIWNEWCNPELVPYGTDKTTKDAMAAENDLGPIYGAQWRNFGNNTDRSERPVFAQEKKGFDQLATVVSLLKKDPNNRRLVVSAWNPIEQPRMALPPCHFAWQVLVINNRLHLNWSQRSVDSFLGLPFNIASYGTLLAILAKQFGFEPGILTGFLGDTHIYENHFEQVQTYLERPEKENKVTVSFSEDLDVLRFRPDMIKVDGYEPQAFIKAEVAV